MLLFFNQETIKDLDKKNEYLTFLMFKRKINEDLGSYFKTKRSRNRLFSSYISKHYPTSFPLPSVELVVLPLIE